MTGLKVMGMSPPVEQRWGWSPRRGAEGGVLHMGRKHRLYGGGTMHSLLQARGGKDQ